MALEQLTGQDTNRTILYIVNNIKGVRTLGHIPDHIIAPPDAVYNKAPYGVQPGVFTFDQQYDHFTNLLDESSIVVPENHTFIAGWTNINNTPYALLSDNKNKIFRIIPATFKDPTSKDTLITKITSYLPSYTFDSNSSDIYTNEYPVVELDNYPEYITVTKTTTTTTTTTTSTITGTITSTSSGTINGTIDATTTTDYTSSSNNDDNDPTWWYQILDDDNSVSAPTSSTSTTDGTITGTTSSTSTGDVKLTQDSKTTTTITSTSTTETVPTDTSTTNTPTTPSLQISVVLVYWNAWSIKRFLKIKLPGTLTFTGDTLVNNNGNLSFYPVSRITSDTIYLPMDFTVKPSRIF